MGFEKSFLFDPGCKTYKKKLFTRGSLFLITFSAAKNRNYFLNPLTFQNIAINFIFASTAHFVF